MRIEWKSERVGVARCPAEFKLLGEDEPAGTFEAYVAIFGTPDRPDFFGDSDVIEPGAFTRTLQEKGLPPIVWSHVWTIPPVGQSLQAVEDAKGRRIKARLFLDDDGISGQYARSIHTGMTATPPVVREFSFAFEAKEWSDKKGANGLERTEFKTLITGLADTEAGAFILADRQTELLDLLRRPRVVAGLVDVAMFLATPMM